MPVIAVGKGEYKFKDVVSIPIKNEGGKLRVITHLVFHGKPSLKQTRQKICQMSNVF